ncbi:MAG TPA: chemotaxis protein CheW [Gemmatimonadaceae bacterium]|nr:chemotaxis protein CheW [Gemmatimonadaceae bacterium]
MVEPAVETTGEPTTEPAIAAALDPALEPAIEPAFDAAIEPEFEPAVAFAPAPAPPAEREHLVFRVGRELFALPLDAVDEAIDIESVQHLPEMSAAMLGVLSLRGSLVPLYAPAATLGVAAARGTAALVFVTPRGRVALAVDDVDDVMDIAPDALQRAPMDFGDGVLVGVARRGADLIGVLDAGALMAACRAEPVLETA